MMLSVMVGHALHADSVSFHKHSVLKLLLDCYSILRVIICFKCIPLGILSILRMIQESQVWNSKLVFDHIYDSFVQLMQIIP